METLQRLSKKKILPGRKIKQKYDVLVPYFSYRPNSNPIIFLHGLCDTRKTWRLVAPIIVNRTGRKAYLIDARNHGESGTSRYSDMDLLTQDVVDFMDDQGIKKVVVVGHSMGGRTAITFALKHPDRTEALIVEDMTPRNVKSGPDTLFRTLFNLFKDSLEKIPADADLSTVKRNFQNFLLQFGKKEFSHQLDCIPKSMGSKLENSDEKSKSLTHGNSSKEEFANGTKQCPRIDFDPGGLVKIDGKFLPEYNMDAVDSMIDNNFLVQNLPEKNLMFGGKALFLYGDSSFFNLAEDRSIKKLFPEANTKKIENAMHLIHLEYPEEFADAVSRFILLNSSNMSKY